MRRIVLFLTISCISCISAMVPPLADDVVKGKVVVVAGAGERRFAIDRCVAGEREMFYGYDLFGTAEPKVTLRAVVDPISGPAVKLTTPDEQYVFRERDCDTLRVDVQRTGWRINDDRDYAGIVVMDCRAGDTRVRADVSVRACH